MQKKQIKINLNILSSINEIISSKTFGYNLKKSVDDLFFCLALSHPAKELHYFEKIFQLLGTLTCIAQANLVSEEEGNTLTSKLQTIKENLGTNEYVLSKIPQLLEDLLTNLASNNPKAKIIIQLTKFEHMIVLHSKEQHINLQELEALTTPIKEKLQKASLSDFQLKYIIKELALILKILQENPNKIQEALNNLKNLREKIVSL